MEGKILHLISYLYHHENLHSEKHVLPESLRFRGSSAEQVPGLKVISSCYSEVKCGLNFW